METSQFNSRSRTGGFSVLEVLVAVTILAIGLSAMAALVAQTLNSTETARYMALATTLTSEKIEDLNRWPSTDPHVAAGGNLGTDTTVGTLNYYDDVDLSSATGQVSETMATSSGGYQSVIHMATGQVIPNSTTAPSTGAGIIDFHRRWLIESNPTVNGVTLTGSRRVTVYVTLADQLVQPGVSYQMSTIRP